MLVGLTPQYLREPYFKTKLVHLTAALGVGTPTIIQPTPPLAQARGGYSA